MSSRAKKKKQTKAKAVVNSTPAAPPTYRAISKLLGLPRGVRILITGVFTLAVTLVVALVVFYESLFYSTSLLTVLMVVAIVLGLLTYVAGWYLIIGTSGENPPARLAILWYVGIGLMAVLLVILWVIQGIWKGNV